MKKLFNISPLSIGDVFTVGLKTGLCIETTLQEILGICPREKKRSDAYKGLTEYLKRSYDITLIIKSQKQVKYYEEKDIISRQGS